MREVLAIDKKAGPHASAVDEAPLRDLRGSEGATNEKGRATRSNDSS